MSETVAERGRHLAEEAHAGSRRSLARLLTEIELPLIPILARMEATGIALDQGALASLELELTPA